MIGEILARRKNQLDFVIDNQTNHPCSFRITYTSFVFLLLRHVVGQRLLQFNVAALLQVPPYPTS